VEIADPEAPLAEHRWRWLPVAGTSVTGASVAGAAVMGGEDRR
jgi:hypothetical protein